jgi:hypothetical protein
VKHLGPLGFFLGVEVVSYIGALLLIEGHYIVNILKRSYTDKSKPCSTPMATTTSLVIEDVIFF